MINFTEIDRRVIYFLMIVVLSIPMLTGYTLKPTPMQAGNKLYNVIESLPVAPDKLAFLAFDFGPNIKAENEPQAEVLFEHLMRRKIPTVVFSLYAQGQDFLKSVPEKVVARLKKENPSFDIKYGRDWVNIGFRSGSDFFIQSLVKTEDLPNFLIKDALGNRLSDMPIFEKAKKFENIVFLGEVTGLVGMLDTYIQFFQKDGYIPFIVHGCTSITIPDAYNLLDSGQLKGLLEGLAGAAWYSELLKQANPNRLIDSAAIMNTSLGLGHLLIIALVIFGNLCMFLKNNKVDHKRGVHD
jgi:hypothetical protein